LIACSVRDFDPAAKTLKVDGKTGPRAIILQPEAVTFFKLVSKGRAAGEPQQPIRLIGTESRQVPLKDTQLQ
jgi:hypothetical protein